MFEGISEYFLGGFVGILGYFGDILGYFGGAFFFCHKKWVSQKMTIADNV